MVKTGLREWLWRGRALDDALSRLEAAAGRREASWRARAGLELGERAHEPAEPFANRPDHAIACELYREASYWSLVALTAGQPEAASLPELWRATDPGLLLRIAGSAPLLARISALLMRPSFVDYAALPPEEQTQAAADLGAFARGIVDAANAPEAAVRHLRAQRLRRVALLLVLLGITVLGSGPRVHDWVLTRSDLAAGKPWRASSEALNCNPEERRCGNYIGTRIFFHTQSESSPWLEIDLQRKTALASVVVRNRTDCCSERALPLVVELSNDRTLWHEVARQKADFRSWTARFSPQEARWVRLRVDGTSFLHLEAVSVFR